MKSTSETKILKTPDYTIHLYIDYFNKRLRVDDYRGNVNMIVQELNKAMDGYKFTKLIYFSRVEHWRQLLSIGFELEGIIKGYFNGSDNYIMTCYKENERRTSTSWLQEDAIIQSIQEKGKKMHEIKLPSQYRIRKAKTEDAVKLAELYNNVFPVYPTPMNNPEYVTKVMITGGTIFYVGECNNELVSAASAEINASLHNAEITDCATLPEHRKYGLLKRLMVELEKELKDAGIYCAFSLARALSYGMNAALFQLSYQYNGRLTNNCFIFDKIENMNVWVKDLSS
ncbi:putative beta-lysine N-acetyltransferase [Schinkia azotoformans]|uniref:Acetyltransferase n=1 Tax=Schinkia azotoformans LMG 9581 TaxID=1131731 RepID=K6DIN8_SCHAZ|nr:putative beta-lysine N-acetyltransferase [Schinkia azotoformans]EKN68174.1 acetyltransferase [Schinkia azotoformans LMG 9581]MEC1639663.1 putative beta-lysine N-acetyltransferase [Schinkia azotoformans]MEC1946963.1 putative beta-lysine N-acetyltransferase [Schinkia azotoformans]